MTSTSNGQSASKQAAPIDYSKATDGTKVISLDPWLEPFAGSLRERYSVYKKWSDSIQKSEGGLDQFSKGYQNMGLIVDEKTQDVTYREWAPGVVEASLFGDFNNWNRDQCKMQKDDFGVWQITIKGENGKCRIPHESKIKFAATTTSGEKIDRIPTWIKLVSVFHFHKFRVDQIR